MDEELNSLVPAAAAFSMTTLSALMLTGLAPTLAAAQTVGLGYAFGAPGFSTCCGESVATMHAGGGQRIEPFVTSGYSLAFRNGHLNLWNVGGGADYWIRPTVGVRMEVRDHINIGIRTTLHLWGPRIGFVIRSR